MAQPTFDLSSIKSQFQEAGFDALDRDQFLRLMKALNPSFEHDQLTQIVDSLSSSSDDDSKIDCGALVDWAFDSEVTIVLARMQRLKSLKTSASTGIPFSTVELESAATSMRNVIGRSSDSFDWATFRSVLDSFAHKSHKDWDQTAQAAEVLKSCFQNFELRDVFQRVFRDGRWDSAARAASERALDTKPWVILVTGLNGIRKTTCMYQPWFKEVLHMAIECVDSKAPSQEELPDGTNSFFRQLDHIMATIANEEFRTLYTVTDVDKYSALKDGIYSRYRMLAEMWGMLLIQEARKSMLNVMVETSGRDPGMFHYIEHCFPDESYRKLVLHFEINDINFAERSVDTRMSAEISNGQNVLLGEIDDLINANTGGPYGSKVLSSVLTDLNRVWEQVLAGKLASNWHKASISITAGDDCDWTAHATKASKDAPRFSIARI